MPDLDWPHGYPDANEARQPIKEYIATSSIDRSLLELAWLRTSQLNGCAYCLDKHVRTLHELGVSEEKIATVAAVDDSPTFSNRERTAIRVAEELTENPRDPEPKVLDDVEHLFGDQEIVDLTLGIAIMNAWNRLNVMFQREPGED